METHQQVAVPPPRPGLMTDEHPLRKLTSNTRATDVTLIASPTPVVMIESGVKKIKTSK